MANIEDIKNAFYEAARTGTKPRQAPPRDPRKLQNIIREATAAEKAAWAKEKADARAAEAAAEAEDCRRLFEGGDYSGAAGACARARAAGYPVNQLPDFSQRKDIVGTGGQAMTKAGIPTWAWVVGGVVVVGIAVYFGRK